MSQQYNGGCTVRLRDFRGDIISKVEDIQYSGWISSVQWWMFSTVGDIIRTVQLVLLTLYYTAQTHYQG